MLNSKNSVSTHIFNGYWSNAKNTCAYNLRVEITIFFMEKILFSLKLFFNHFYGQSFIKTVRGPLTKTGRIFATFTESFYKNMWILPVRNQEISHVFKRIIRSSISILYDRSIEFVSPHSKGYNSLSKLYFTLCLVPV